MRDDDGQAVADSPGRTLLKDVAYRQIRDAIQFGKFPAGTFLSERQLVEQFHMSKTPIRSALEHLEAQGLVKVSPQQGIVVCDLSHREMVELFEVRCALEPFVAASLAGRQLEPRQRTRLEDNIRAQKKAAEEGDALTATRLDVDFHMLLAHLLDNQEILAWMARCFDKLYRAIVRINRHSPNRLLPSYREHTAIARAVVRGQTDTAAQCMTEHLRFGKQFLVSG